MRAEELSRELSDRHHIEAAIVWLEDSLWVRIAAQAYNEPSDYERLSTVIKGVL